MSIRIHEDSIVPQYPTGKWSWNAEKDELTYLSWNSEFLDRELYVESSSGFKFKTTMNQIEETIFRQEFTRRTEGVDKDAIRLEDIKNLVLFLAPSEIMTSKFVDFVHTRTVDRFLNALIIYFEYFLRLVEYILIRRDEVTTQVENNDSMKIKRIYSNYLAQYRILLAREYSVIVMGTGDMAPYYHMNTLVKISNTYKDRKLHEALLAFATQIVWIAHHRRGYEIIDGEMNRLFRTHHFKLTRKDALELSKVEREILFGQNYQQVNCRRQNSPLIQEIANVRRKNLPILWIGEKKYRGNDMRMQQLELEFIVQDSELCLIDVKHGILGNPPLYYNTMLVLDIQKVREWDHTQVYDPYLLVTQPYLEVPKLDRIKGADEHFESYFAIKDRRYSYNKDMIKKWKRRDQVVKHIQSEGLVITVTDRCKKEIATMARSKEISVASITTAFLKRKKFLRKQRKEDF